jgi:hypothetical protein
MHHTRKKRNHNKSKGLKNNNRNLKSKSKNSRKVNKMKGGLASCTPGFSYWGKISNAWENVVFTSDEIIQAVTTICDKFNNTLEKVPEITKYDRSNIIAKTIKTYIKLDVRKIISKLKILETFNYENVSKVLDEEFVFMNLTGVSVENSEVGVTDQPEKNENMVVGNSNITVNMCQLMKTIYYLILESRNLKSKRSPVINDNISEHFAKIAPDLNIKGEALEATHTSLGQGFRLK